jgi:tetratricopeptide (TPR) repeat protein
MLVKRLLSLCCLLTGLLPIHAGAQQHMRFRPDNESFVLTKDAAANQLYAVAALNARSYLQRPATSIQPKWLSEDLTARYTIALAGLKTAEAGAVDSAKALLSTIVDEPVRDRISLAIARYYFVHSQLAAAIPYYESAGIANLSNVEIADAKFELAYCYFNNRQFEQANTLLSVMKEVPGKYYSPGNYNYGLLTYTQGDYNAALKSFERIKDESIYRPVVPYYMAEIYYFMGDRDKALAEALRLINLPEKLYYDNELHLLAAQCLFEAGRYGDALPYFEHYYEHTEKIRKEELYEMGYAYYRVNEWKSAIDKFKPLSEARDSLGQTAMYLLGDCYLKTGNKESARNAFGICASMPYNAGQREAALLLHAKLSYETGFADDAMRSVRTLLSDYPNSSYKDAVQLLQSQLYLETSNYKDAYEALASTSARGAEYARVHQRAAYGYALQQWQAGRMADANILLSEALNDAASPDYTAAAQFWKAEAAYRLHQYDSAALFAQQFLSATGAHAGAAKLSAAVTPAHASLTLGYASMERKDFTQAQAAFGQAKSNANGSLAANASLRQADAYFMQKEFAKAAPLYASAAAGAGADADYARLQSAIIAGLRGDDAEKTRLLQTIISTVPTSSYASEARYELGVSQIAASHYDIAIGTLQPLTAEKSNAFAAKAVLKTGTAQQQLDQDDKALETYKQLLRDFPAAPERSDALAAVKSIYIERNQPDAYTALLKEYSLPQASDEELDAAYYNAAEVQYAAAKWDAAATGFGRYLEMYPTGAKALKARYYLANSLYNAKAYRPARQAYDTLLQQPWNNYSEESATKAAEMAMADTAWADASRYYEVLAQHSTSNTVRVRAFTGLMRTTDRMGNATEASRYADSLLMLYDVPVPVHDEALMRTLRRRIASNEKSPALDSALKALSQSENGVIAAEARYTIAQALLSAGKLKEAEAAASNNIKKSAGYEYWLVKTYLLLSDVLIAEKDYFNARATLQSVAQNSRIPALKAEAQRKLDELKGVEKSKLSNE